MHNKMQLVWIYNLESFYHPGVISKDACYNFHNNYFKKTYVVPSFAPRLDVV